MTMGTASTMACMTEALGLTPPGGAAIPAVDSRRGQFAEAAGRQIVALAEQGIRPSDILTPAAFDNAIRALHAISGSTNAIIHLIAYAGRLGIEVPLSLFDQLSETTPWLVNLKPAGDHLMEDFYYAGGLPAVLEQIHDLLHLDALTVTGQTLGQNLDSAATEIIDQRVIRPRSEALDEGGSLVVLRGNLCPDGAVIKPSAATVPKLLKHRGRAVVFSSIEDFKARIDDPALDIDENCVMVLQGAGPKGYPGFPELGNLPLPKKVLQKGIMDMVRISDARMSGTAYGAVVLHVSPESAIGGPLALVKDGDMIELDVEKRRLHLDVSDAELAKRRTNWKAPAPHSDRGWVKLYQEHVQQAHLGCDLDFLIGKSGSAVPRPSH
jgi:dihydroxy-acid dehydratase